MGACVKPKARCQHTRQGPKRKTRPECGRSPQGTSPVAEKEETVSTLGQHAMNTMHSVDTYVILDLRPRSEVQSGTAASSFQE